MRLFLKNFDVRKDHHFDDISTIILYDLFWFILNQNVFCFNITFNKIWDLLMIVLKDY